MLTCRVEWGIRGTHPKVFAKRSKDDLNQRRRSNMVKANKANESVHERCAAGTQSGPVNLCDDVAYTPG